MGVKAYKDRSMIKEMIRIGIEKSVIERLGGVDKVIEIAKKAIYKTKTNANPKF